ncbi:MAG: YoaK family protein [Terrimicrobiaceae bacterium]|nr:YoaK family protein [Terrimicrobiaceae bacterium]
MAHERPAVLLTPEALALTALAGCVDAAGFITFGGLFVAHMSGNSAALGAWFGQGLWEKGLPHLFAIPVFVGGLVIGYSVMQGHPTARRCAALLAAEAALLGTFVMGHVLHGRPEFLTPGYFGLASLLLLAMGMQNATLRQIGRSAFPSTYVTGVLDTLGRSLAALIASAKKRQSAGEDARQALAAASLWICYALGAVGASAALVAFGAGILAVPVVGLLLLAAVYFWRGEA